MTSMHALLVKSRSRSCVSKDKHRSCSTSRLSNSNAYSKKYSNQNRYPWFLAKIYSRRMQSWVLKCSYHTSKQKRIGRKRGSHLWLILLRDLRRSRLSKTSYMRSVNFTGSTLWVKQASQAVLIAVTQMFCVSTESQSSTLVGTESFWKWQTSHKTCTLLSLSCRATARQRWPTLCLTKELRLWTNCSRAVKWSWAAPRLLSSVESTQSRSGPAANACAWWPRAKFTSTSLSVVACRPDQRLLTASKSWSFWKQLCDHSRKISKYQVFR